jgi:hypothetical protein
VLSDLISYCIVRRMVSFAIYCRKPHIILRLTIQKFGAI